MLRFVGRRLIIMFITLYLIISVTWVMSKALPGTPFADEKLTPSSRQVLYEKYGLDDPLPVQYVRYMLNVAQGDLGNSFYFESRPVTQIILEQAPDLGIHWRAGDHIRPDTRSGARHPGGPAAQRHPGLRGYDGGGGWYRRAELRARADHAVLARLQVGAIAR